MKKREITRATVVMDNKPVRTYNVKDTIEIDHANIEAYMDSIKTRYAHEPGVMEVDLVYKEIEA